MAKAIMVLETERLSAGMGSFLFTHSNASLKRESGHSPLTPLLTILVLYVRMV